MVQNWNDIQILQIASWSYKEWFKFYMDIYSKLSNENFRKISFIFLVTEVVIVWSDLFQEIFLFHSIFSLFHALFVLEVLTFLSWLFAYVENRFDKKALVNFKIHDITGWTTNSYNTHITEYVKRSRQSGN